ncbi:MAG: ABC transporter substrate-binding protein [Chloroflexi bacterium]|nr:ABC transporter substrate-binding protein [Chloroflexota bacterium]
MERLTKPSVLIVFLTMALGLLAAACGGGEEATPVPTRAPAATATRPPATAAPSTPTPRPAATAAPTATTAPAATRPAATATAALSGPAGKLTVAISSFVTEDVQPSFGRIAAARSYLGPMYDSLFTTNEDGSPAPGVIQRWQMAADAKSWTLDLRPGMRFHNGDPVTADDVKFTYDIVVAHADSPRQGTNAASYKASVESVTVLSPTSVRVNLKRNWPLMPYDVGPRTGSEGMVVPKAYTDRVGETGFEEKPIGTGPWQLVRRERGVRFVYQPSPYTHPYRSTPAFKEMELLLVPEESTRIAMLRTGAADMVDIGSFDTAASVQKSGTLRVLTIPRLNTANIVLMGYGDPRVDALPLGKKDVRQALFNSINTKEIIDTLFTGLAEISPRMLVTPGTLGWDPSWTPEPYNPTRAKELLAAAGYSRGFSVRVYSYSAPGAAWMPRLAEAAAGYWSNIGITPQIVPTDAGTLFTNWRKRPQPEDYMGQATTVYGAVTPTNMNFLRVFFHSGGITYNHPDPRTDALIDQALGETDTTKQVALIRQFMNIVHGNYTTIPVAIVPDLYGIGARIGSWKNTHLGGFGLFAETITSK